jgi:tetratricopeptide (TPR) repeat protein
MADRMKKLEAAAKHYTTGKEISWSKGDYDVALAELRKSLQIRESIYGFMNIETSDSYYEIGRALFAKREYNESLVMYRKCLRIRISLFGRFNTATKNADHCVRLVVQARGLFTGREVNEAMDAIYKSLNHEVQGDAYRKAGRNAEAQIEYIKAAAIEEYHFGNFGEILGDLNRKAGIKAPPPPRS